MQFNIFSVPQMQSVIARTPRATSWLYIFQSLILTPWCRETEFFFFFGNKNVYLLINVVYFKVVSFGLYTASPMIVPLFKVFCAVHSLKLSKYVQWLFWNIAITLGNKFWVTNCFWGKISQFLLISRRCARIWQWKLEIGYGFWGIRKSLLYI